MAKAETNTSHTIMLDMAKLGVTLIKNVRGKFWTLDKLRMVLAGLSAPGSSDLIGWTPVIITPGMVGQKVAVFTAIEVKTAIGTPSKEQENFISVVKNSGGYAGIARNSEDAQKIVRR